MTKISNRVRIEVSECWTVEELNSMGWVAETIIRNHIKELNAQVLEIRISWKIFHELAAGNHLDQSADGSYYLQFYRITPLADFDCNEFEVICG